MILRRLRLWACRLLANRQLIDPALHPVLSKHPEILGCPGAKWRRLSEMAPASKDADFLSGWYLVSLEYSEDVARRTGKPVAMVKALKSLLEAGVAECARNLDNA